MNSNPDNNWAYVEDGADNPFTEKPFQEGAMDTFQAAAQSAIHTENESVQQKSDGRESDSQPDPKAKTDDEETKKRAAHEAAEEQRRAEFDARQEAKKQALQEQIARVNAMSNDEAMNAAIQRTGADTEKLVRRNMKEMVTEYIQTLCIEDSAFARMVLQPRKSMIRCFQYINRKAFEYVQDEMKANGIRPGPGMQTYGSDIPDDVCYQWAEEYFRDPTVKEDQEQEEQFVPKPYPGKASSPPKAKKTSEKKKTEKKEPAKKSESAVVKEEAQLSFGQMAIA